MGQLYDPVRLDTASASIAAGLRAMLAKPYPQLTAGEKLLAQLRALHLVGIEMVGDMGALARETPSLATGRPPGNPLGQLARSVRSSEAMSAEQVIAAELGDADGE
jgi:hypothetical protein